MLRKKLFYLLILATTVAVSGCNTSGDASCRVFKAPAQVVRGDDTYSKRWVDKTVEAGIAGCGWQRPQIGGSDV